MRRAWAGHYEVNTVDHNAIIGPHPEITNLVFANVLGPRPPAGAGGGRGLRRAHHPWRVPGHRPLPLGYERIAENRPLRELNVV